MGCSRICVLTRVAWSIDHRLKLAGDWDPDHSIEDIFIKFKLHFVKSVKLIHHNALLYFAADPLEIIKNGTFKNSTLQHVFVLCVRVCVR